MFLRQCDSLIGNTFRIILKEQKHNKTMAPCDLVATITPYNILTIINVPVRRNGAFGIPHTIDWWRSYLSDP